MDIPGWVTALLLAVNIVLLLVILRKNSGAGAGSQQGEIREEFRRSRDESATMSKNLREEIGRIQKDTTETLVKTLDGIGRSQTGQLEIVSKRISELTESNENTIARLRSTVDEKLREMQDSNEKRLDRMRETVDEKLQSTLEKRLGESFNLVSERLEAVQRGLGEMQNLATGVGDLQKSLTNVKTRGVWGEVQLGAILEQILTTDQYEKNVKTKADSAELVEFAIKLPGPDDRPQEYVYLPIDSKFPQEDYIRLVDASEKGNADEVQKAVVSLMRVVHSFARDIRDKYLDPPRTTDFAIMFLPTEGLYAEVLRQAGEVEKLQNEYRIVVAGPTTLTAILSSLRMGFRTLAIEKRSSEVWKILSAVKTEFGRFGEVLARVKRQLSAASNTIEQTDVRTRQMNRKLRQVEELPAGEASDILELEPGDIEDDPEV
ncbi:MAG: DNA recombination protein RmuC [Candidatus Krumholzibacteriota bacterium]|nr:DNA recombination protein RmuC [Candidatus Krumholzibacteriota bacterium]